MAVHLPPTEAGAVLNPAQERYLPRAFGLRQVGIRPRVSLSGPAWPAAGARAEGSYQRGNDDHLLS